jgi:hypothetical protein
MIRSLSDINEEFLSDVIGAQPLTPDTSTPEEIYDAGDFELPAETERTAAQDGGTDDFAVLLETEAIPDANDDVIDLVAALETEPMPVSDGGADDLASLPEAGPVPEEIYGKGDFEVHAEPAPDADDTAAPFEDELISRYGSRSKEKTLGGPKLSREFISIAGIIIGIILIIIAAIILIESSSGLYGDAANDADMTNERVSADAVSEPDGEIAEPGEGEYNSALDNLENELNTVRESQQEGGEEDLSVVESDSLTETNIAPLYLCILGDEFIESADTNTASEIPASRKDHLTERIYAYILYEANREKTALPSDEEINSDLEFTNLTEPANALINAVNAGREDKALLLEVISLREEAYGIYPLGVLKKLLAADYEDLGLYYAPVYASESFDAFIYSIKYRMAYLSELNPESGARRTEIGRVGRTFTEISGIGDLDDARKWHAKLIASCLFDMSASKAY